MPQVGVRILYREIQRLDGIWGQSPWVRKVFGSYSDICGFPGNGAVVIGIQSQEGKVTL